MPALIRLSPQLSVHYGGEAGGPARAFGIEIGDFAVESENLLCADPALAYARAGVLHYFEQRNRGVTADRLIFRFHESDQV